METATSLATFCEGLNDEDQRRLRAALDADPELAEAFRTWLRMRSALRSSLDEALPDRHLLVLYALDLTGRNDGFTSAERQALTVARPALGEALERHPALQAVVDRLQDDVEVFEATWAEAALDRPPMRRGSADPLRATGWRAVRPPMRRVVVWTGRVAALLAVAAVTALFFLADSSGPAPTVVRTAGDEVREVELPDGSWVRLMGDSELAYQPGEEPAGFDRQVAFEGRAYFKIRTDPARPFSVETPEAKAVVLGTEFGMEARDERTEVVLAEGKVELVALDRPERRIVLAPREKGRVVAGEMPAEPVAVDLVDELGWTGLFVFKEEPYEAVARHLSRHYGVEVEVDPRILTPAFGATGFTGDFSHADALEYILETIPESDDRIRIERRPGGGFRLATVGG